MKKLVGMLMVLVLLFGTVLAMAEDTTSFEPTAANTIGVSGSEWLSSKENRALLTIMLAVDLSNVDTNFTVDMLKGTTYVGYLDDVEELFALYSGHDAAYLVMYTPLLKTASYSEISPFAGTESTVELGLEAKGCTLYKNSPVIILSVVDQLVEILEL